MRNICLIILFFISSYIKSQDFYSTNNLHQIITDQFVCFGDTLNVDFPNEDYSMYDNFIWTYDGVIFSQDSSISIFEAGTYQLELYGVDTLIDAFDLIYFQSNIEENLFDDISICNGDSVQIEFPSNILNASEYNSFDWYFNNVFFSSDTIITISQTGSYQIYLYGCDTISQNFELSYYSSSLSNITLSDTTICEDDEVIIPFPQGDFDSYFSFVWLSENDFYSSDSITTFNSSGNYTLELYGCDTISDNFTLTVHPNSTESYNFSDSLICNGDTIYLEFPDGDFSNFNDFTWYLNNEFFSSDSNIVITLPGEYSLHMNGCPYLFDNFYVDFYEYPLLMSDSELNVDSVIYICIEDNPTLITPFADFTHTWFLDGIVLGADTLTDNTLVLEDILDDTNLHQVYTYDVEIDFECAIVASNNSVEVSVLECECGLDMPNVFTPDGDEINDYFKPFNNFDGESVDPEVLCRTTNFNMEIFNQWGKHITSIESNDDLPSWDGLNDRGKEMNAGIYFYRITYQVNIHSLPKQKEITGYFHLFR